MILENIFKANDKKRSHLKNLVAIAKLDNKITKAELKFLFKVGEKVGVAKSEIKDMIDRTHKVVVSKPETIELTLDYIYDLVEMSLADGVIDEEEIQLTIDISEKLGLNSITSGVIVRQVFMLAQEGKTKNEIISILKSHLLF